MYPVKKTNYFQHCFKECYLIHHCRISNNAVTLATTRNTVCVFHYIYLCMKCKVGYTHATFSYQIVIAEAPSHLMQQKPGKAPAEWMAWHRLTRRLPLVTCFTWFHRLKDHFLHGVVKEIQIPIAKDHFGKTVLKFFVGHFILV